MSSVVGHIIKLLFCAQKHHDMNRVILHKTQLQATKNNNWFWEEYNNVTGECEGKGRSSNCWGKRGNCSRPICLLDSCCVVVVGWWCHFFPLFGLCVVLLALPGELGTGQVSYEWAKLLFWLFLPVFWKLVNLWWWYEALKAKFLGSWVMESSMLYCTLITMVWIEIFFTKLFWGFQGF